MAKRIRRPQDIGKIDSHSFDKSLQEDLSESHLPQNVWTQARNATLNTTRGDIGELSNEQSNKFCASAPYTIMGLVYVTEDKWLIFSTDDIDSEIGLFEEGNCSYTTIVNDKCLNFSKLYLIIGAAKENHDCTWTVYFADSYNPDRALNIDNVPWVQQCTTDPSGCTTCIDTDVLDCDAIRLEHFVENLCFNVTKGPQGGELLNGSYFVVGAYTINNQRVTDYSIPSNVQPLFHHSGIAGSLEIIVEHADERFDEFELVIVQIRNLKTLAKRVGFYSTKQQRISLDAVFDSYDTIDLDTIPLRNSIADKCDGIFETGDYLIRSGPTDKLDFNYQPLANQIGAQWVSVEYPADYYIKGGYKTNYLRDEVYSFFIRWVYDTGDKSASFHIPGRPPALFNGQLENDNYVDGESLNGDTKLFHTHNTASVTSSASYLLPDNGRVIGKGKMGYWESTEIYDDDKPQIWNATYVNPSGVNIGNTVDTAFDLCGKPIRHHRFPADVIANNPTNIANHYNGDKIRIMGVEFDNILPPVDNDGNPITNIVGYEILRGTREGNKSILAKGMINAMRPYVIAGSGTSRDGLYPNYPYNPSAADKFITQFGVTRKQFTFHSPDTQFKNPFLSAKELAVYGEISGDVDGKFEYPENHPKHQLITNFAFIGAMIGGIAFALIKKNGALTTTKVEPRILNVGNSGFIAGPLAAGTWAGPGIAGVPIVSSITEGLMQLASVAPELALTSNKQFGGFVLASAAGTGASTYYALLDGKTAALNIAGNLGVMGGYTEESTVGGDDRQVPVALHVLTSGLSFVFALSEGAETVLRLIRALSPYYQYALQYDSHCFYDTFSTNQVGNRRHALKDSIYLDADLQDFGTQWRINNLYRGRSVALETENNVVPTNIVDTSQVTVADAGDPTKESISSKAASHYVGLKQRLRNQYGQIEGIIQIPVTNCTIDIAQQNSDVLFGGDTYIGRHTEKNTMFFYYNWLHGQPDGEEFNYKDYMMIPGIKYYMDTFKYNVNDFFVSLATNLASWLPSLPSLPSGKHNLDPGGGSGIFIKKEGFMHLFNSGVRDFFVESEINVSLRDWGDGDAQRHYDPYGFSNKKALFNSSIIKSGNYFKYDFSLSISRLYNSVTQWGHVHRRDYDPDIAETCYTYRPNRLMYSLPQQLENKKDNWKVFLPNNYKDFKSRVTSVKPINKSGALILFENESPVQFQGVDTLQTDLGTKLAIGDGGLFSQPLQNLLNTDPSYEYGSCQNRLSVVNTASGVFWMSQNQGKIFHISNGINEISAFDTKWWLATYLPYVLTQDPMFDNNPFELTDNPVAGIGCQAIYDNKSQIVYFCKKDYFVRPDIEDTITYVSGDDFLVNRRLPIKLGDPAYFENASWTISYDPKTKAWISYHDWHPDLLMPAKKSFLSVVKQGTYLDSFGNTVQAPYSIWKHNDRCDSYCNFYGTDYPFEVEFTTTTPQVVNTLRSVEYYMETYKYNNNCYDRFHDLDFNFDEAVIYNSEQCSGLLRLRLSPKNDPAAIITYPRINPDNIEVLYSKEEQKYRFNQFWDITDDRGEYNPVAERTIFNTEMNGYIRNLNANNLDYNKLQTQRKKFRHYKNVVLLRRKVCGNKNMLVSLANNKNLMSPR